MGKVTALMMDTITDKSGHQMTGMAVSVCLTPAAPSPLPIPYPTMGTVAEGVIDECMRTKIENAKILTVGGCMKVCHGNEPGTLKEVVSLNTAGPCFPWLGAPIVLIELGMAGITGSMGQMNKSISVGGPSSASGAGGGAGGGGGGGGGGAGPGGSGPQGPAGGGGGGGGSASGAAPPSPPAPPTADGQASAGHPVDVVTGAMFTGPLPDIRLPGFFWLNLLRGYQSSAVETDVGIGRGWSHSLAWHARVAGAHLILVDDQARATELPRIDPGASVILPFGRTITREGDELRLDLGDGIVRVLSRDEEGVFRLAALRDGRGHLATITWSDGRVVGFVDTVGRRGRLVVDDRFASWWVTATDRDGGEHERRLVTYETDERGDLVGVVDAGGGQTRYAYDDRHYLVRETRADGLRWHFVYSDVAGERRCVETWGDLEGQDVLSALGAPPGARGVFHARLAYGPGPFETTVTDAVGAVRRYRGNALGLVEHHVDPAGYTTSYRYDDVGRIVASTDAAGNTTAYGYGPDGRLASRATPRGPITFGYGDRGLTSVRAGATTWKGVHEGGALVEETLPDGRKVGYSRDEHGLVAAVTRPDGTTTTTTRDSHGNVATIHDPASGTTTYTFDVWGRPTRVGATSGADTTLEYDSAGWLVRTRITGPDGHGGTLERVAEHVVDVLGRVAAQRLPGGGEVRHRFVGDALVERTLPDGSRWRLGHDALLRLIWAENPAGERMSRVYDTRGLLIEETTFAGLTRRWEHDALGRVAVEHRGDGSHVRTLRSRAGAPVAIESSAGQRTTFEYDGAGALTRATSGAVDVQLGWDEGGRLTHEIQTCGGWRFRVDYEVDEKGRPSGQRYSTDWSVAWTYGEGGLTEEVALVSPGGARSPVRLERDAGGRITSAHHVVDGAAGPGWTAERDALGLPTRVALGGDAAPRERRWRWSAVGAVSAVEDEQRGTRTYAVDPVGRTVAAMGLGASERVTYTAHGTAIPASGAWSVGRGGRPTRTEEATLEWDRQGRLAAKRTSSPATSWTYSWDEADRLVGARRGDGRTIQMLYDAFGRRVAQIEDGASTFFGWAGDAAVEERRTDGRSVRRVFAADEFTPLLEDDDARGPRLFAVDGASTPWAAVPRTGTTDELDLGPFGAPVRAEGDLGRLRFAGHVADPATGLHYNRHRWFSPELHTYLSPDPIGLAGSDQDVGFLGNVTFIVDPLGLWVAIIHGMDDPKAIDPSVGSYQRGNPGARTLRYDQLAPGSLAGATQVVVVSHGQPGSIEWGQPGGGTRWIRGEELGEHLNNAGFDGTSPGAQVDVVACNGATPGLFGGNSVAQGVSNRTLADARGAQANNRVLGALGLAGTTRTAGPAAAIPNTTYSGITPRTGEYTDRGSFVTVSPQPANR